MSDTDLAKTEDKPKQIQTISVDESSFSSYLDTAKFNQLWRVATVFAGSDIVPDHYKNKPNNCFLALQMSTRLEIEPMMFIQNSYVVHGKPGLQSVVAIALVNSRGPFTGPIQWKFEGVGKTRKCTAYATHKVTGEVCESTVSWEMVEAEGWNKKPGSKWNTLPDLMFQYRSASFLAKLYCPEVILGLPSAEELMDIEGQEKPEKVLAQSPLNERLRKPVENTAEPERMVVKPEDGRTVLLNHETETIDSIVNETAQSESTEEKPETAEELPASGIAPEERWYCKNCDQTFAKPKGTKNKLCPSCLSKDIVDRIVEKPE